MNFKCICKSQSSTQVISEIQKSLKKCETCSTFQHHNCLGNSNTLVPYECPSCQIQKSDFFTKTMKQILTPKLFSFTGKQENKSIYMFNLDDQTIKHVQLLKSLGKNICLMLRSLRLDNKGYENHFPMNCQIQINDKILEVFEWPKHPPRAKSRVDEPFVFTLPNTKVENFKKNRVFEIDKFFIGDKNTIILTNDYYKNDNDKFNYAISLDIVEFVDIDRVASEINSIYKFSEMKSLYEQCQCEYFLNAKISLIDVFTQSKIIETPVRSNNCNHFQVFDLKLFLSINKNSRSYNCPICKKKALNLYIDGFLSDWMKRNPEVEEILIDRNYKIDIVKIRVNKKKGSKETEKISIEEELLLSKTEDMINYNAFDDNPSLIMTDKVINKDNNTLLNSNIKPHKQSNITNITEDEFYSTNQEKNNQEDRRKEKLKYFYNLRNIELQPQKRSLEDNIDEKFAQFYSTMLPVFKHKDILTFLEKKLNDNI